jgi:hypothetical protein
MAQTLAQANAVEQGAGALTGIGMAFKLQRQHDVFQGVQTVE